MRVFAALAMGGLLASCAPNAVETSPNPLRLEREGVAFVTPPVVRSPEDQQVLFWNADQRSARFRDMESWFEGHEVEADPTPSPLPQSAPLPASVSAQLDALMAESGAAGVMVLQNGRIRYENYGLDFGSEQRWTSFSVAKSFTSTLLGAALRDGYIRSLDDKVTRYIPGLRGSAYDDVTVGQLATMTSGVAWNEDYTDPNSDVAQLNRFVVEYGDEAIVAQMRDLPREAPAGEKFVYKTGETNLIGMLVEQAVSMPLAAYAKDNIVDAAGFEGDMFWMSDPRGGNIGGCCLSLRLADYARFGQFVLDGGGDVVPADWFDAAGAPQVELGNGFGYGYQWWTYPGGNFGAQGIFGQAITLVPDNDLVLAVVGNWPSATDSESRRQWLGVTAAVAAATAE